MNFEFTKMHHLGNDFIMVDFRKYEEDGCRFRVKFDEVFSPDTVKMLCDRHFGIGADGVVGVFNPPSKRYDLKMRIINSDGSEAKMCGNGLACFALFAAYTNAALRGASFRVETLSGPRGASIKKSRGGFSAVLDMGEPVIDFIKDLRIGKYKFKINSVSMGNPHCVIFVDEPLSDSEFERLGPAIERHRLFPDKTNVEFVTVKSRSEISVQVWERGAGKTLACGTGASAAAFMAVSYKFCGPRIKVLLPGGSCRAEIKTGGHVHLECSPVKVFEGNIELS